jgi:hypothetical protein
LSSSTGSSTVAQQLDNGGDSKGMHSVLWLDSPHVLQFVLEKCHRRCGRLTERVLSLRCNCQYLHHTSDAYRNAVRRKIAACHRHIQLGLIAQGLLQFLSARMPELVWRHFGSWIRTVRPGLAPSEQVVAVALRNTLPQFLATAGKTSILVKFIRDRLDLSRAEGTGLAKHEPHSM